ncbi:hypothetical protein NK718_03215 [Alsobacter sp. SYSU M60028]|uniref:Uncharacterized protein n=1 Tax=Alsobacter ponti TaxID=2962936 RepID=A0ABT1L7Q4_9HYPH|nr:hypothetical protein [Alsobacter ponti]MCP8937514.1 hypothetical protein [Alsobacter ponti]
MAFPSDGRQGPSIFARFRDRLAAMFERNELDGLSREQIEQIAADLDVQTSELYDAVVLHTQDAPESAEMMARFGITPEMLGGLCSPVLRDVRKVCHYCEDKDRCHRELAEGTAREHAAEFCPNEPIFASYTRT